MSGEIEEWRVVPWGAHNYEVSNHGRIRNTTTGKVLNPTLQGEGKGHRQLNLYHGKKVKRFRLHRLVAEAFIPNPKGYRYVLHWDDNPDNNHVDNLRWGTQADNLRDTIRNGNHHETNKTQCRNGHPYSTENTYLSKQGHRTCKICARKNYRKYYHNTLKQYERDIRR